MLAEHLDSNILNGTHESEANRVGYGKGLKEAGEQDERIVALSADLTGSTKTSFFADAFPERFVQMGIGEQSMASVGSGLAAMGKIPFIASYAMFSPGRSWEQVRTTIAYNNTNVKIIGAHAGVSVGPDGATHQAIEDMAIMRVVPRMTVLAPCDVEEARKATHAAAAHEGPVYIRLAREPSPVVTTKDTPFEIGEAQIYYKRDETYEKKVGIIASGIVVSNAILAAQTLNEEGIGASVMNLATIKPLDTKAIHAFAEEHDVIMTVEEHQIAGGMGSAVTEYLSEHRPTKVIRLGVHDTFGQSGTMEELLAHYGLDSTSITNAVRDTLS